MKRILFYLFLAGGIVGSTVVVLWMGKFLPLGMGTVMNGQDIIENFLKSIANGTAKFGFTAGDLFVYAIALFVLINAAVLLTMILIFLFSGFNLNRIARFYRICGWFFFSSLLLTASYGYLIFKALPSFSFSNLIDAVPYYAYIPIGASFLLLLFAIIFRATEKKR